MPPRTRDTSPRGLVVPALLLACTPAPPTAPPPSTPGAPALATPEPIPATLVISPRPVAPACPTITVESSWQPPGSTSKPRPLVDEPRVPVRGRAAAALVQRTLARRCPALAPVTFEDSAGTDGEGATWLGARPIGTTASLLHEIVSGNGVYAEYDVDVTRYDLVACTATSLRIAYADAALTGRVDETPPANLLRQVVGPAHDRGDPAHAYATLLATTGACVPEHALDLADGAPRAGAPALEVLPLPFSEQPWFAGPPRPQARVWRAVEDGAQVIVPPTRLRRLRVIDGVEVFGADLPGRNGGLALALYDPRADRHRWLLFTRGCLMGTAVYWLAAGSGLAVGYAASRHPVYWEEGRDGLFVLDLVHARVYRLLLDGAATLWEPPEASERGVGAPAVQPEARQIGRLRKDASTLRSRCGTEVPLSAIRTAIDAVIPTP